LAGVIGAARRGGSALRVWAVAGVAAARRDGSALSVWALRWRELRCAGGG